VAHLTGSYVARLTPIRHPHTSQLVSNIITLATPHSNPLYAFDKSVHDVHQQLLQTVQNNNIGTTLLVTILGGLRDKMIEPALCQVNINHPAKSKGARGTLCSPCLCQYVRLVGEIAQQQTTTLRVWMCGNGSEHCLL
jgi:hypothetical protein